MDPAWFVHSETVLVRARVPLSSPGSPRTRDRRTVNPTISVLPRSVRLLTYVRPLVPSFPIVPCDPGLTLPVVPVRFPRPRIDVGNPVSTGTLVRDRRDTRPPRSPRGTVPPGRPDRPKIEQDRRLPVRPREEYRRNTTSSLTS